VNFWVTWCAPCREELPSLERLRDALRGRPFEVLAVNVAEGESRVKRFLADVPLRLPVLLDRNGEAQRAWRVRGLPATFLLDPERKRVIQQPASPYEVRARGARAGGPLPRLTACCA